MIGTQHNQENTYTVTGVFATRQDAENAYHLLMELGYSPDEITLIMSDETKDELFRQEMSKIYYSAMQKDPYLTITDAVDSYGKFIALPGVALMVAGDLNNAGARAVIASVMSDKYAHYYRTLIKDGQIVIDLKPHTVLERNIIKGLWQNYGGTPMVRRPVHAA